MDNIRKEYGLKIRQLRKILPEIILQRQYEKQPHLRKQYTERHEDLYKEDTAYHLSYLAEAVSAEEPKLFTKYIEWAKVFFAALPVSDEDLIINLELLKEELSKQLDKDITQYTDKYIAEGIAIFKSELQPLGSYIDENNQLKNEAEKYLEFLLQGNKREANKLILDLVDTGVEIKEIYLDIFQVTQLEVGRLWQLGKITVAQEHFITAATQLIMSQLYPYIFQKSTNEKKIIVACVPGELHELGARMLADIFEMEGWNSYFYGANTPQRSLVESVKEHKPEIVAISATMTYNLTEVTDMIYLIKKNIDMGKSKVLVGGYPFTISEGLWKDVGADGYARNAVEATQRAKELIV